MHFFREKRKDGWNLGNSSYGLCLRVFFCVFFFIAVDFVYRLYILIKMFTVCSLELSGLANIVLLFLWLTKDQTFLPRFNRMGEKTHSFKFSTPVPGQVLIISATGKQELLHQFLLRQSNYIHPSQIARNDRFQLKSETEEDIQYCPLTA